MFLVTQTIFWSLFVLALSGIKALTPGGSLRQFWSRAILYFSSRWIHGNRMWLKTIAKTQIDIDWQSEPRLDGQYLLVANHQSWVDILMLQDAFYGRAPFLRFFLKKQLFWIPFLGQAFWALDFPFMHRYSKAELERHPEKKGKDLEATQRACHKFAKIPFTLINFPEGTRFQKAKQRQQNSPFTNLLKPKAGGTAFALESFSGQITSLLDVSIIYPGKVPSLIDLLAGRVAVVKMRVREMALPADFGHHSYQLDREYRRRVQSYFNQLWQEKDQYLSEQKKLLAN